MAGLALGTGLIGWYGFGKIGRAIVSVGGAGFAGACAWQMALFAILGLCWYALRPPSRSWRPGVLIWGRMVRDAAGGCLPFSLVGGFVLGARAVTLHGIPWRTATASTVVDLTAEFIAQILFVVIGVGLLLARSPGSPAVLPVCLGLAAAMVAGLGFVWAQRRGAGIFVRFGRRILESWGLHAETHASAVLAELASIYRAPWRVALGTALHLAAWFGTAVASLIGFRLLGADIGYWQAFGIEALLHAVLAGAILVPGYAGVQEAAYAGVGAMFGQPAEISLGVSLLRRSRDIALGVPILLVWQAVEWHRRRAVTGALSAAPRSMPPA